MAPLQIHANEVDYFCSCATVYLSRKSEIRRLGSGIDGVFEFKRVHVKYQGLSSLQAPLFHSNYVRVVHPTLLQKSLYKFSCNLATRYPFFLFVLRSMNWDVMLGPFTVLAPCLHAYPLNLDYGKEHPQGDSWSSILLIRFPFCLSNFSAGYLSSTTGAENSRGLRGPCKKTVMATAAITCKIVRRWEE